MNMKTKVSFPVFPAVMLLSVCFVFAACAGVDSSRIMSAINAGFASDEAQEPVFTNAEAVSAMKDALVAAAEETSGTLSKEDGYFGDAALKILLPEEASSMLSCVDKSPGGKKLVDDVVLRLNRSAEAASKDMVPIFSDAITEMTVTDGIAIVCGEDNAATEYLREKTYDRLFDLYQPKMASALEEPLVLGVSADEAWNNLTTAYNKAAGPVNAVAAISGAEEDPMPEVEVDLASYATGKALDGIFLKIEEEEKEIRANPLDYASQMIQKVFGAVKDGLIPETSD